MRGVAVLVTGVGYIGAQLVLDLLDDGETVVGLENVFSTPPGALEALLRHPRFCLVRGSVSDPAAVARAIEAARPSVVYHLAAQSSAHPQAASIQYTERSNLVGPRVLLEALRGQADRVVLGSSFRVLGDDLVGMVGEDRPHGRVGDPSHLSKIYLERLGEMLAWQGRVPTVAVRLGITYGLGAVMKHDPRFQTVPNRFCAQAAAGERLQVASGRCAAFIHVQDAARALRAAARMPLREPFGVVNAAPDVRGLPEVAEQVRTAGAARGLGVAVDGPHQPGGPRFSVQSSLAALGWAPSQEMPSAIAEVLDYFLSARAPVATGR
jgi:nucleoside-diphosphate-sugar epimerase